VPQPSRSFSWPLVVALLFAPAFASNRLIAQEAIPGPSLAGPELLAPPLLPESGIDPRDVLPESASQAMLEFLASIVRDNIPEHHADEKDWNQTKRIYAGIKFRREGIKLETERRWKTVNHGVWQRYEIDLVNPDQTLAVRLSEVRWLPDGRLNVRLTIEATALVNAWQTHWNHDVRLYSIHCEAKTRIVLDIHTAIEFSTDTTTFPPALVIDPEIRYASIQMADFHVNRLGNLGGDVAQQLGEAVEGMIRSRLVKPKSEKFAEKLNSQIEKKRDRLRIDAADWMARWLKH
jgi:hypothetical protein